MKDSIDIPFNSRTFFIWLPQLAEILDLDGLKALQTLKKSMLVAKELPPLLDKTTTGSRHAAVELACYLKRAIVRRVIMLAQNEGKRKQWPSKLFTMNKQQKNTFLENFRSLYLEISTPKKKKPLRNARDHVFGATTPQIVEWLLLNERGSLAKTLL